MSSKDVMHFTNGSFRDWMLCLTVLWYIIMPHITALQINLIITWEARNSPLTLNDVNNKIEMLSDMDHSH